MTPAASTALILATWERAYGLGPVEKGLMLLALAVPREPLGRLAEFSIGRRDSALLELRSRLFGQRLQSVVACAECGEQAELNFTADEIRAAPPTRVDDAIQCGPDGRRARVRPITSADLLATRHETSSDRRREALFRRCVEVIEPVPETARDQRPPCSGAGSMEFVQQVVNRLAEVDPQADVRIAVDCPRCGNRWSARFDIVSYLWAEIDTWARRLLAEVHSLALAYGWSEQTVLGLTPWRRQIYLEMLRR